MYQYHCLNPIAAVGLDLFSNDYEKTEDMNCACLLYTSDAADEL